MKGLLFFTSLIAVAVAGGGGACSHWMDCLDASAMGQASASQGCSAGYCASCNTANGWTDIGGGLCGCDRTFSRTGNPRINWKSGKDTCMGNSDCETGRDWQCNQAGDDVVSANGGFCNINTCACNPGFTDVASSGEQVDCECVTTTSQCKRSDVSTSIVSRLNDDGTVTTHLEGQTKRDCRRGNGVYEAFTSFKADQVVCLQPGECLDEDECGNEGVCNGYVLGNRSTVTPGTCGCHAGEWVMDGPNGPCTCPNTVYTGKARVAWNNGRKCMAQDECQLGEDWECKTLNSAANSWECVEDGNPGDAFGVCECKAGFTDCDDGPLLDYQAECPCPNSTCSSTSCLSACSPGGATWSFAGGVWFVGSLYSAGMSEVHAARIRMDVVGYNVTVQIILYQDLNEYPEGAPIAVTNQRTVPSTTTGMIEYTMPFLCPVVLDPSKPYWMIMLFNDGPQFDVQVDIPNEVFALALGGAPSGSTIPPTFSNGSPNIYFMPSPSLRHTGFIQPMGC